MKMSEIMRYAILGYICVALALTLIGVFTETFAFAGYLLAIALPITIFGSVAIIFVEEHEERKESKGL